MQCMREELAGNSEAPTPELLDLDLQVRTKKQ
jgi:hypothetical protein